MKRGLSIGICLAIAVLAASSNLQAATYQVRDLGFWDAISDINGPGQVVGTSNYTGQTWDPATGFVGIIGAGSYPSGVNIHGVVAGQNSAGHAFTWSAATGMAILPGLTTLKESTGKINASGQVVGTSYSASLTIRPVLWAADGTINDLGAIDGNPSTNGEALDINDTGQVVGDSGGHAFLWSQGQQMRDLGLGRATAINAHGAVVVNSQDHVSASVWTAGGGLTPLNALPGWHWTCGTDINSSGQVAGYAQDADGCNLPIIWNPDGTVLQLPVPSDAMSNYTCATCINDSGWVAGSYRTVTGEYRGLLWTPVPEPSSILALIGGLTGLGGVALRRRKV